jgi:F-type H+-transporting ATPase subunit b
MTLPVFLAAAAAAAEPSIPERFGLEPKYIVMQVISFLIVLFVLYKFGIKPVTATMEERNRKIEAGLRRAAGERRTRQEGQRGSDPDCR